MPYTTEHLLASVKLRSLTPRGQYTFQDPEVLQIADEEMRGLVVPSIMGLREEYFVTYSDIPLVGNQATYAIPARASGMIVRDLAFLDASMSVRRLRKTEIERIKSYSTGSPDAFYFIGNKIALYPFPAGSSGSLRVYFSLAPSKLVSTAEVSAITDIDTSTNELTLLSIPSTWVTGNAFDLSKQDGGQEPLAIDLVAEDITDNVVRLPSLPSDLRVGDYISLAGQTALLPVPCEYREVLAQATAARILGSGEWPGADRAEKTLERLVAHAERQFKPRSIGEPDVIITGHWS